MHVRAISVIEGVVDAKVALLVLEAAKGKTGEAVVEVVGGHIILSIYNCNVSNFIRLYFKFQMLSILNFFLIRKILFLS